MPAANGASQGGDPSGTQDHQAALDKLLEQAEAEADIDTRPEPSELSDPGDESSQLTELDEDDDPTDPQSGLQDEDMDDGSEEDDEDEEELDTEAETERLEISPEKLKRSAGTANIAAKIPIPGRGLDSEDEDLAVNAIAGAASDGDSSLTDADEGFDDDDVPDVTPTSQKRKAGSMYLNPDVDGPRAGPDRKRSISTRGRMSLSDSLSKVRSLGLSTDVAVEESDEDAEPDAEQDEDKVAADEDLAEDAEQIDDKAAVEDGSDRDLSEPPEDLEQTVEAEAGDGDEEEAAEEEEGDPATKSEDEIMKRKAALDSLMPIENLFAIFRDKLYDEKLAVLSAELDTLQDFNPSHPDYLTMLRTLDQRRDEKIRIEQVALGYKLKALETKTVAERATLHGQFIQTARAVREHSMEVMNEQFSRIQRERRQWKVKEPQYFYKFAPRRSLQIAQQSAYNKEVSLLSGIARNKGFPAAPEISGAASLDIENDLRMMKIRQQSQPQYLTQVQNTARVDEALAEKQFIQKHAWANPDHPAHRQALLTTPANQRMNNLQHSQNSGSTIDATSNPPSGVGVPNREPGSSPFDQFKQRLLSTRPSPVPGRPPSSVPNGHEKSEKSEKTENPEIAQQSGKPPEDSSAPVEHYERNPEPLGYGTSTSASIPGISASLANGANGANATPVATESR